MNEEMQTTGYTGADSASGPTAGYDPVQRVRGKIKKKDAKKLVAPGNKLKEGIEMKSRLFQYKVKIPNVGETVLFASSPAELKMKLRMSIMPNLRSGIEIERILPANAAKYFMDRRMDAMRNIQSESSEDAMKKQMAMGKIAIEKKKIMLKKQQLQKQLQLKTQNLKKQVRAGAEQDETR